MTISYEITHPAAVMDEVMPLVEKHWGETGFDFPLNPSKETYQLLHDVGAVYAVVVREDGKAIGYCSAIVMAHPHNREVIIASSDALFLDYPYRKGLVAGRLISKVVEIAKSKGAEMFAWHTRAGSPLAAMLHKRGYEPADDVVMRRI